MSQVPDDPRRQSGATPDEIMTDIKIDDYTEAFDDLNMLRAVSWETLWRFALAKAKTERTWKKQLEHLVNLPNFSYEVFESITGISKQQILE